MMLQPFSALPIEPALLFLSGPLQQKNVTDMV